MPSFIQKTLVLIKPDAMERNLAGEIIARIQRVGLRISDCRVIQADEHIAATHYPNTQEWLNKVGNNTLDDCKKYNLDPAELLGTDDPVEVGKMILRYNKEFLMSGPVLAIIFEGNHAIEIIRKLAGHTVPVLSAPGTIRGDYSNESAATANIKKSPIMNLIHASGNEEEANREIELWFGKDSK